MLAGRVWSAKVRPVSIATGMTLGDVVAATKRVPDEFYIPEESIDAWVRYKAAKSLDRTSKSGHSYRYSEGAMPFPDPLDRPARTIITGEGGAAPSRFKHVVRDDTGRHRRLTPEELEALNGFPRGFTDVAGLSAARRAFLMGNALVVDVVRRIGAELARRHSQHDRA